MKAKNGNIEAVEKGAGTSEIHSALDLWRLMGGQSHRVGEGGGFKPDSMLAVLGDRVTYTFILDDEVASIHFDRQRGEIFFKGHNIRHMELNGHQMEALRHMKAVLSGDDKAKRLLRAYCATLDRFVADNSKGVKRDE